MALVNTTISLVRAVIINGRHNRVLASIIR